MTTVVLQQTAPVLRDVVNNTEEILSLAKSSLAEADIVVFPELANSGYITDRSDLESLSQETDGPLVESLQKISATYGGLSVVGFPERDGNEFFNTVVIIGSDGPILKYRKMHLFDSEKIAYSPGDDLPVIKTDYGVLAASICYDLRFVEVLRILSLRGAEIVLAPAAWVAGFDSKVPATGMIQQAKSVEVQANLDQVAVVAVSQAPAKEMGDVVALGGSIAVDSNGVLLAGPLSRNGPDQAVVDIDPSMVRASRFRSERIRPREDRRTDVYSVTYGEERL